MGLFNFFKRKSQPAESRDNLATRVTLLADNPTIENRDAFFCALLTSKVGSRLPADFRTVRNGQQIQTASEDQLRVPTVKGPDGTPMLLVYCDIPGMQKTFPNDRFFEFEGRVVLEMAQANNCGIVVQNETDGRQSWGGVSKEDVPEILASEFA